jgi:uncharacterized membrane protein YgcG
MGTLLDGIRRPRVLVLGYGLESVLPDGLAGEVIRTDFLPRFRDGDYRGGIQQGVNHVIEIVQRHEPLSAEERRRFGESSADDRPPMLIITPFLGLFIALGPGRWRGAAHEDAVRADLGRHFRRHSARDGAHSVLQRVARGAPADWRRDAGLGLYEGRAS